MDDQQARKVNEAAEKFAQSLIEAYQALADRSVSAQELNAHLTQSFFNRVIENLGTQAESNPDPGGEPDRAAAQAAGGLPDPRPSRSTPTWSSSVPCSRSPPGDACCRARRHP